MKPILDADGMADYTEGMSRLERSQVLELWRLQQFEAGRRASENARSQSLEGDRQYRAGALDAEREMRAGCAKCGEPPLAIHHIFHFAPYPAAHKFQSRSLETSAR